MHLVTLLPLAGDYYRMATDFPSPTGQPILAFIANVPVDPIPDFTALRGDAELIFASIFLLCSIGLAGYFTYAHHQTRSQTPKGLRKTSLWTVDQVNACLITFGLAVMFFLIHYSWQ